MRHLERASVFGGWVSAMKSANGRNVDRNDDRDIRVWLGLGGDEGCLTVDVPMHRLLCRRDPQSTEVGP